MMLSQSLDHAAGGDVQSPQSIGDPHFLTSELLAFFCSVKCPGSVILKTYDLSKELGKAGIPVIGGFHSPIEKECMIMMLRGDGPVVWCVARSIQKMRVPKELRPHVDRGRLSIVSTSPAYQHRPTKELSAVRNRFVADHAKAVFVAYADPGGQIEKLCHALLQEGKPIFTFDDSHNKHLITAGVQTIKSVQSFVSEIRVDNSTS